MALSLPHLVQPDPGIPAPVAVRNFAQNIILGVIVAAIMVIAATVVILWQLRQADMDTGLADLTAFDLVLAAQTERNFESVELVLTDTIDEMIAAEGIDPDTFGARQSGESTHRFLSKKATSLPQLNNLLLVDAKGTVINSSHHYPTGGGSVADRDYFVALRDHPELRYFIGAPVVSRGTNTWTIFIARRINAPDGSLAGVLLGAIALDYFNNFYRDALATGGRSATLWRDDGTLLARYPMLDDTIGKRFDMTTSFQELDANGGSATLWIDGKIKYGRRAIAERRLGQFPIIATTTRTEESILASWRRQAIVLSIGAVFLIGVITLAAWLMIRQVVALRLVAEARSEAEREIEARQSLQVAVDIAQTAMDDLKRSEERFRDIAEVGSDWIWETDEQHRFTMVAGRAQGLLDLIGKTRWEGIHGDPNTDAQWRRHKADLDSHVPFQGFRFSFKLPNGQIEHVMATGKPVFDNGTFKGYRGTVTNETALVSARERAERADMLLRDAIESLSEGFVIFDEDDRYVMCNDAYRSLYPGSADQMVPGRRYEDILRAGVKAGQHPDAIGQEEQWITRRLARHRNPGAQTEARLADGTCILVCERRMANGGIAGLRIDITALKHVQESLHDSQAVLNRAQRVAQTGSAMRYFDGDRIEWSDELYRIFGVTRETFKPRTALFLDLIHPEDRDAVEAELIANDKGPNPKAMQFRVVHSDGAIRWVYRDTQIWFDSAGVMIGRLSTYRDVTARHLAEVRQMQLERLLRDAIESISEGFVIFDPEDRLVTCNQAYRDLYPQVSALLVPGTPFEDILRHKLIALGDPTIEGNKEAWIAAQLRQRGELGEPVEQKMADGRWILAFDRRMSDGGTAGLRVDITALKAVQNSWRESQERLERTQRISHTGSVDRDLRTGKVEWSDETYRIFGVTRGEFSPSPDTTTALVHPDDRASFVEKMLVDPEKHIGTTLRYRVIRPDGTERIVRGEPSVIYDADDNPERIVAALTDVTESELATRRQADLEAQLNHSEKLTALGTLAGGIAHDLNNTLVPIQALSKLLLREFPDAGQTREDLETILDASLQARDLVQQILAFSRKQNIVKQSIDLVATIRTSLTMLRASVPRTIELVEKIESVPPILADNSQVQQVIINLVTNAAQAIGDKIGRITVSLSSAPADALGRETIELSITDTGRGISDEMISRIFEPFFTTKPVGEGTGLGLSVVHGIVASHGGTIDLQTTLGEGSTFIVRLPAQEADTSEEAEPRAVA